MEDEKKALPFIIKLCSDKSAYEVRMKRKILLKMDCVKQLLETSNDNKIIAYTPHILIFKSAEKAEVTLSKNGRMLIKKAKTEDEATAVARQVFDTILKATI